MKILVLTSIYPQPDDIKSAGVTPVVHYFAKEWVKMGHKVVVVHNANRFILPFYMIPSKIVQNLNSKLGMVAPNKKQRKRLSNELEGIKIYRIPITKLIPRGKFFNFQIKKQFNKIRNVLELNKFEPDLILGHWENPQIPLVSMLKKQYNCKTSIVFHGVDYMNKEKFKDWDKKYMHDIDILGARSSYIEKKIKENIKNINKTFICYSGIPEEYIDSNDRNIYFNEKLNKNTYVYVGQLIERKNVNSIIEALNIAHPDKDFKLDIIGIGQEEKRLKELVKDLNLENQVNFMGRVERNIVREVMKKASCFTMISRDEAFGLVYLEAMSCGCMVIGSKNEGIDGVIVNNENGFLCSAGNVEELAKIYKKISKLNYDQKHKICNNALNTVKDFTDYKVAKNYIRNVIGDN